MTAIRIYLEGAPQLRPAFGTYFRELRMMAQQQRIKWEIIACGPRDKALRSFQRSLVDHPDAFNILLVDSESPVSGPAWEHLKRVGGNEWVCPGALDSQCQLMVQIMEAWFLADVEALKKYYGQGFHSNALSGIADVESLEKDRIYSALKDATRNTQKRAYHKTRHAPEILERLDSVKVRKAAHYCDRLFQTIADLIEPPGPSVQGEPDSPTTPGPNDA